MKPKRNNRIPQLERLSSEGTSVSHNISKKELDGLEDALQQVANGEVISGEEVHARLKSKYNL